MKTSPKACKRPMLIRIPDQSMIVGNAMKRMDRVQATRGFDDSYAFVYITSGKAVTLRMDRFSGKSVKAYWYDPRKGTSQLIGEFPNKGVQRFDPPSSGRDKDWVLTLDAVTEQSQGKRL